MYSRPYKAFQVKSVRAFDVEADIERMMLKSIGIKDSELDLALRMETMMNEGIYCNVGGHVDWSPTAKPENIYKAAVEHCSRLAKSNLTIPSNASPKLKEMYKVYIQVRQATIAELKRGGIIIKPPVKTATKNPYPELTCGPNQRWNWCVKGCVPAASLMPDCAPPPDTTTTTDTTKTVTPDVAIDTTDTFNLDGILSDLGIDKQTAMLGFAGLIIIMLIMKV